MINEVNTWIDEIPPIQQPMRFGNKAFRIFYDRVCEVSGLINQGIELVSLFTSHWCLAIASAA